MDENDKKEGKGIVSGTADTIKKLKRVKAILAIVGSSVPAIGFVFLIILAAILVFMPLISVFSFAGGIFNSSTTNNERVMMPMNLEGFEKEDVQIFQIFYDESEKYKKLKFKKHPNEEIDLSLLISTIQNQGLINFNDENGVFNLDDETDKAEEEISNFETLDDFNAYIDKYGPVDSDSEEKEYKGESIVLNEQNISFYNNLKDKGGNVYYIYPGTRMLLGYMVANDVQYSAVMYEEWECDGEICNNADEIWSDWGILRAITSDNGTNAECNDYPGGSAWGAICNINSAISFANSYSEDPESWKYKNIKYDLQQLKNEVLDGSSSDAKSAILGMFGDEVSIPDGNFMKEHWYVAVSVEKYINYDLYENYTEDVFIRHLYLDCDNCELKDESDDIKKREASTIYNNIYSVKQLFDYFNDESIIIYDDSGGGTPSMPGVSYSCGDYYIGISADYSGHNATDLTSTAPQNPNVYPLMEGTVIAVNSNCSPTCPRDSAISYTNGTSLSTLPSGCQCGGGWGNYVKIQSTYNGKTIYAIYAHLDYVNVQQGDQVKYNTILGSMGNTGVSTGRHLHIELNYTNNSDYKFPPQKNGMFSDEEVKGTLCERSLDSGETNE